MFKAILMNNRGQSVPFTLPKMPALLGAEVSLLDLRRGPERITMDKSVDSASGVLIPTNEVSEHLIRLLPKGYTLMDVNDIAHIVSIANNHIKRDLEQNILHDQYRNAQEMRDDIRQMTYDAGTVSKTYYFPLTGKIWPYDFGDDFPAGKRFLMDHEGMIREKFAEYARSNMDSMSAYFHEAGADKLLLADWGLEVMNDELYGKVDTLMTEPMTEDEESRLRNWIHKVNAHGIGQTFECQVIQTDKGNLSITFCDDSDNYSIFDAEEIKEKLEPHQEMEYGGM